MSPTQPLKKIVGLAYDAQEGQLPCVVVKGCGEMADRMLRERDWLAGPALVTDAALVEQLYRLPMDGAIGPDLFQLVAQLLSHVFALDEKFKGKTP
jgi:type III secretion system FlhB-like substrate exporter